MFQSVTRNSLFFAPLNSAAANPSVALGDHGSSRGPFHMPELPEMPSVPWHELLQTAVSQGSLSFEDLTNFAVKWQGALTQQVLRSALLVYLR